MDVPVPMRDGTKLATNIWRPVADDSMPVLLMRVPYGKNMTALYGSDMPSFLELLQAGYALAVQDTRGAFRSGGTFVPHVDDPDDGVDTIRWLAGQDWCDGNVGALGGSYMGMVQWSAAATGVPELKAIAPALTSADFYRAPWYSRGGALSLDTVLAWAHTMSFNELRRRLTEGAGDGDPADLAAFAAVLADRSVPSSRLPVADQPLVRKYLPFMVDRVIERPDRDENWNALSPIDRVSSITTPALHIGGWYDLFYGETLRAFTEMKRSTGSPEARAGQRLVMGPWSHINNSGNFPDRWFGMTAAPLVAEITKAHLAFYDRWLRGREDALDGAAPVRIFVMGIDQWRDEQDWPLPDTRYTHYYLDGAGPANTAGGAGILATAEPATDTVDTYLYDPRRPVASLGGTLMRLSGYDGPADQRPVHDRDDVLVFTTCVLEESVEVTGPVTATLFVSSSAVDTDFTAKLVDVHPDGRAIILCDGILRMRYRDSLEKPEMMQRDEIYEITVELIATSNVFLPGHRILLEISSSNFPRYDRNSNTGGVISAERESEMIAAVNHLHRGPEHPSRLTLPVIDRR